MVTGESDSKWLTPQEQKALGTGYTVLIDSLFDEWNSISIWKPESILATRLGKHLPRQYAGAYTPLFLKQFGVCVVTVAWKLAQPKPLQLSSFAEELAAWAIVEEARAVLKQETEGATLAVPAFQNFLAKYFEETHLLSLFDPHFTEREASAADQMASLGSLEDWFQPKASDQSHVPHPYGWGGKSGTNVGRAYKKWLSSSEREALAAGIDLLIDELFEDFMHKERDGLEDLAETTLAWHLPLHYLPKYSLQFLKQFSVCIMTVAWKLAQPKPLVLSSVAEELAAWALLTAAKQHVALMQQDEGEVEQTVEDMFEDLVEIFFEDTDFLFLFDHQYDGIETSTVGQLLHMTSLSFADWFRPFNDDPSYRTHPYVFRESSHA